MGVVFMIINCTLGPSSLEEIKRFAQMIFMPLVVPVDMVVDLGNLA